MNTARQMMAAARRGHLPTVFSFIHVERMTPIPILTLNALATLLILAIKDFRLVLVYTSYIGNIVAFGSALSLVIMRFKRKDIVRPFKLPLIVPIMLIVFQFAALGEYKLRDLRVRKFTIGCLHKTSYISINTAFPPSKTMFG